MSDLSWLDEKPTKEAKARTLDAADLEIERLARSAQTVPRRGFFSIFSAEFFAAIPVAGIAGLLGFWLVSEKKPDAHFQASSDETSNLLDETIEIGDVEIVNNLEFFEDFELLEELKDEEMAS
jgi:hypothetical protein